MKGKCDYCKEEKEVDSAKILYFDKVNWNYLTNILRCSRCKLYCQIAKPFPLAIIMLLFLIFLGLLNLTPTIAFFTIFFLAILSYNIYCKIKIYNRNLVEVLDEKQIPNINMEMRINPAVLKIELDEFMGVIMYFGSFFCGGIFIFIITEGIVEPQRIKNNAKLEYSLSIHKKFGLAYVGYNKDSHLSLLEHRLHFTFCNLKVDNYECCNDNLYYDGIYDIYFQSKDQIVDSFISYPLVRLIKRTAFIPVVYDSTNRANGYMLLAKANYNKWNCNEDSLKIKSGLPMKDWQAYDSLVTAIEIFETKGHLGLRDYLLGNIK